MLALFIQRMKTSSKRTGSPPGAVAAELPEAKEKAIENFDWPRSTIVVEPWRLAPFLIPY